MLRRILFATLLPAFATAASQDTLPEIVVTADWRGAGELVTPTSVTVINDEVIRARQAEHVEELLGTIPNVNFAMGTSRARFFQIRGIGERSQFAAPINPSVGVLVDNVDFSGAGTTATLLDVAQVEVLRGPQGTRYGANALAGLINIRTNDPDQVFDARLRITAAEYNTRTLAGVINGGITESLSGRLAVQFHESDGYYDNSFLSSDDNNRRDETSLRGKLLHEQGDWRTVISLSHVDVNNGYDAFSLDNTRTTLSDNPGHDRQESLGIAIDTTRQGEQLDVQVIVAGSASDLEYGYDEDWSFTGIHPDGYTSFDNYQRDRDNLSVELRLLSNELRLFGGTTDWVAGLYYLTSEEDLVRTYTFLPGPFTSDYDFDSIAAFGQFDTAFGEHWLLSTGLRIERRSTTYGNSDAVAFSPSDDLWGGRIALQFLPDEAHLWYLSIARGYKAGGFNTDGSLDADLREFDPEFLLEYELGFKGQMLNDRLQLRAALFHDDRQDQQVNSSLVRQRPDGSTEFIGFLGNAAAGTNQGLEVEADYLLTSAWRLRGSIGLLDASFDEFINAFGEDLSGRDQAQAPSYTYSLATDYRIGRWNLQVSVDGKDDYFFSDRHGVRSDAVNLVNANIGYESDHWAIRLWGRNLLDETVLTRGFGSFGNDPRKGYVTEPYFQFGEPRIVGVTLEVYQ